MIRDQFAFQEPPRLVGWWDIGGVRIPCYRIPSRVNRLFARVLLGWRFEPEVVRRD